MKRAAIIIVFFLLHFTQSKAQIVLNEVYTDPGSGKHEFFELFNPLASSLENLDCYTLVTYYEEFPGKTGFYVMDLPNMTVPSRSYFIGASANPYNIQTTSGLTPNFSWNAMPAGGALYKMEKTGASYTSVSVPANLNDFFYNKGGGGANYSIMLFKNGVLINALFGGASSNVIPAHISAMPNLPVTMLGSCTSFSANFSLLTNNQGEYVTPTPGNDNGYIRTKDGKCGTWNKASSGTNHTPGASNGETTTTGDLTISTFISCAANVTDVSIFRYNVTGGPAESFMATIEIYRDLGTIGILDAADVLINSRQIANSNAGVQSITLSAQNAKVIMVVKSPAGCLDAVISLNNTCTPYYTLPVKLTAFNGTVQKDKVSLFWSVANNENSTAFEIEKSVNGRDFISAGKTQVKNLHGYVEYNFIDTLNNIEKVFYRLKYTDKLNHTEYSNTLSFTIKAETQKSAIKIFSNPVNDNLSFSFPAKANQITNIEIYNLSGTKVYSKKINSLDGNNHVSIPMQSFMQKGTYLLVLSNAADRQTTIFLKN